MDKATWWGIDLTWNNCLGYWNYLYLWVGGCILLGQILWYVLAILIGSLQWHQPRCPAGFGLTLHVIFWESWPIASSGISAVIVEFVWVWEGTSRQSFKSVEEIWDEMINSTYWYCFSPPLHYKPWNPQWCNWHCRFVWDLKLVLDGLFVIVSWYCDDWIFLELLSCVFKCWSTLAGVVQLF